MKQPKRIGRFTLRNVYDSPAGDPAHRAIFAHCVILRAEYSFAQHGVEYVALSPLFDEIDTSNLSPYGGLLPEYEWIIESGCSCGHTSTKVAGVHRLP